MTGSFAFGLEKFNDIDILIMKEDLPNLSFFEKFDVNKNYSYKNVMGNKESFKIEANRKIFNIIVFDNKDEFVKNVKATEKIQKFLKNDLGRYKQILENKSSRILLYEFALSQV